MLPLMIDSTPELEALANTYGLTRSETNPAQWETLTYNNARQLMHDTMKATALALTNKFQAITEGYFSDDDTDYLNAIRDQVNALSDIMLDESDSDDRVILPMMTALNNTDTEWTDPNNIAHCFTSGYADHPTPLSKLMIRNHLD